MKKILSYIAIVTLLTTSLVFFVGTPKTAYAACSIGEVVAGNGLTDCVNELVVITVMPIVGKMLQITAYLFDKAIILNMNIAQFVQSGDGTAMSPVEVIWRLIRDLSGMFFIFLLMYSAIRMMLGLENSKNVIVGVIIAGMLINFSLFLTKVAIDASNSLTLTIYDAIVPTGQRGAGSLALWGDNVDANGQLPGGISSKIMSVVNIQTLFASTKTAVQQNNFNVNSIVITVGGITLMLFLGIAFLAAAVMFLWRFILLLGLMAFSPVWALGYAFPDFKKHRDDFLDKLVKQCLFAPIFLFYIYVALRVLTDPTFLSLTNPNKTTFANVFAGSGIAPLVQYVLVLFIIYSGLGAATAAGAKGGEFGKAWMKGLAQWGQGVLTTRTPAFLAQHTLGRGARAVGDSESFKNFAKNNPNLAVLASGGLKKVSGGTFGGSKGGYDGRVKNYAKARADLAKTLSMSDEQVKAMTDQRIEQRKSELKTIEYEIKNQAEYMNRLNISIEADPEGKTAEGRNAKKQYDIEKQKAEKLADRKTELEKEVDAKNRKNIEKEMKEKRVKKFAENIKNGWNPLTKEANEEAADSIEKSLKKTSVDKMLKSLAAELPKDEEGGGGDKKGDKK